VILLVDIFYQGLPRVLKWVPEVWKLDLMFFASLKCIV